MEIKTEKCSRCGGKGAIERYPYYATIMPEKRKEPCEACKGRGRVLVIPTGMPFRIQDSIDCNTYLRSSSGVMSGSKSID